MQTMTLTGTINEVFEQLSTLISNSIPLGCTYKEMGTKGRWFIPNGGENAKYILGIRINSYLLEFGFYQASNEAMLTGFSVDYYEHTENCSLALKYQKTDGFFLLNVNNENNHKLAWFYDKNYGYTITLSYATKYYTDKWSVDGGTFGNSSYINVLGQPTTGDYLMVPYIDFDLNVSSKLFVSTPIVKDNNDITPIVMSDGNYYKIEDKLYYKL